MAVSPGGHSSLEKGTWAWPFVYSHSMVIINCCSGLPWWHSGKESTCQCRVRRFHPRARKMPHALGQLSLSTTTIEPVCHSCWGPHAWSACSATREAVAVRSPCTTVKSSPRSPQLKKALVQQRRPSAENKDKINCCSSPLLAYWTLSSETNRTNGQAHCLK